LGGFRFSLLVLAGFSVYSYEYCLGFLYAKGQGVAQNDTLAVSWWEKAAVGDDPVSQYNLGMCYMRGKCDLPMNVHCAKIFMMAAAAQGHAEAIEELKLLRACAACGAPDASRACKGCKPVKGISTVRYCNRECQKACRVVGKAP